MDMSLNKLQEKVMTEDEMAGWHHRLDEREFEWTPGVGDGQGGLACCDSWDRKESDMTERLNWTELMDDILAAHKDRALLQQILSELMEALENGLEDSSR